MKWSCQVSGLKVLHGDTEISELLLGDADVRSFLYNALFKYLGKVIEYGNTRTITWLFGESELKELEALHGIAITNLKRPLIVQAVTKIKECRTVDILGLKARGEIAYEGEITSPEQIYAIQQVLAELTIRVFLRLKQSGTLGKWVGLTPPERLFLELCGLTPKNVEFCFCVFGLDAPSSDELDKEGMPLQGMPSIALN